MNCKCRCGCTIWSSAKSHRLICRHCEAGKHTGAPDEGKKGRLVGKDKRRKCRLCRILIMKQRGEWQHDPHFYQSFKAHEVVA